jgi:hypothetical protein
VMGHPFLCGFPSWPRFHNLSIIARNGERTNE